MELAHAYDLVIRNGLIVDGTGQEPFRADVAVSGDCIVSVGTVKGEGRSEIDASGKLVTPGFVDIHTHYDGQATWENTLKPSSQHGVTTVVMGNCGVGFAPCKPAERDLLIKVMEGVEDIPQIVLSEGVPWEWQTFPEYLDFLAGRQFDLDCAAYIPHGPLRVYVMGERGARREPSTEDDRRRMRELVAESIVAGAIGVATSRSFGHCDSDGNTAPHVQAAREEMLALAEGLRDAGRGVFEVAAGISSQQLKSVIPEAGRLTPEEAVSEEIELYAEICRVSGRPVTFSLTEVNDIPDIYRLTLELVAKANEEPGVTIMPQVYPRPIGMLFGLELSLNPFSFHPSYRAIAHLPLAERVAEMRKPEVRARILADESNLGQAKPVQFFLVQRSLSAYPSNGRIDYEPCEADSIPGLAAQSGKSAYEVAYDSLLNADGKAILFLPLNNFAKKNLDSAHEMLVDANTLIGLGDGGAHYGFVCDASYPTFVLNYWVRDRIRGNGARIPLADAVHRLSQRNARIMGLTDRGVVAPSMKADLNVIDLDSLELGPPEVRCDLPANGRRVTQSAAGIMATIVSGTVTYSGGQPTGELPGRLIRANRIETISRTKEDA